VPFPVRTPSAPGPLGTLPDGTPYLGPPGGLLAAEDGDGVACHLYGRALAMPRRHEPRLARPDRREYR
jgi:hypothetical protein